MAASVLQLVGEGLARLAGLQDQQRAVLADLGARVQRRKTDQATQTQSPEPALGVAKPPQQVRLHAGP